MVGGLAITILCCVSAAAHCMLFRTLYRNRKWAPSAPPKVLPAPGTLKSFADVAAVTGKGKRLKGQADGLACAPSGDSPSAAALASKFGAKFGAKFQRRKVPNEAAAPIAALSPASASESMPSGSPGFSHGFSHGVPKSADSCMSPASHSASKSSPTPPTRGVGLTSGGWALLPGAKAGRNPVEMVMKLRFEPVPTLDGMTIEDIIRLKEDHAALKLKLESERSEVESLLRAVRQYEETAGKFLSSPSMRSVLSAASLTTTLTVGTQGWRARARVLRPIVRNPTAERASGCTCE